MINLGFLAWFLSVKRKADVFRGCQDLELRSISENLDQVLGKLGNCARQHNILYLVYFVIFNAEKTIGFLDLSSDFDISEPVPVRI